MSDFSAYDIPVNKYKKMYAAYLQNDGTQLMNKVIFQYDLINQYKERIVEFWSLFDIDWLENEYIKWKRANVLVDDSEWVYTDFLEKICRTYQITREYYSYWAIDNGHETTNILLSNLNMIRLLKIRRAATGFDGTRESLVKILERTLTNKYSSDANSEIKFVLRTNTDAGVHATLQAYIIKPVTTTSDIIWTDYDLYLAKDGQYFIDLLGIATAFEVISSATLVYDIGQYTDDDGIDEFRYK